VDRSDRFARGLVGKPYRRVRSLLEIAVA